MSLAPGSRLGPYGVLGSLGAGGVVDAKASLLLHALHGDPRWSPFLKKLGLEG